MMKRTIKGAVGAVLVSTVGLAATAEASHFRGGALIPTIENGILTVVQTTFWRKGTGNNNAPILSGIGGMTQGSIVNDTSDSRYDRRVITYTRDISNVAHGLITMQSSSCCRVATGGLGNWLESDFDLDAAINWDGTDNDPINFDFGTIQSQVSRLPGNDYVQSLNATSSEGFTLTYNQDLNTFITAQVPGFTVDPVTGVMTVTGDANRALITDNTAFNAGADAAFSGNIIASDGSFVEFDWMFDGVDQSINQAPIVDDAVINALIGPGPITHTFTGVDPEGGTLTWDPNLVLGAGFINALPTFDPLTQLLSWDTTGYAPGQYIIQARAFDPLSVGDFGTLTVNLSRAQPPQPTAAVPSPGTLFLFGAGLIGLTSRKFFKRS